MNPMHARAQAGVGLIEVLIALLILSLGMLGMAGLQMWSLKSNQGSMERGMAVMQTHTIVDSMRAARTDAMDNEFDIELEEEVGEERTAYATAALTTWRQSLLENLGTGATGGINCNGARCVVTIQWQDRQAEDDDEEQPQQLTTVVFL